MKMKFFAAVVLAVFLAGCAATQKTDFSTQLPVQYATMKLIEESDKVDAEGVVSAVNNVRALMEEDATIDLGFLADNVRASIDWASLAPSDRLLINSLISQIEQALARRYDIEGELPEDARVRLSTLLDYIEEATYMVRE